MLCQIPTYKVKQLYVYTYFVPLEPASHSSPTISRIPNTPSFLLQPQTPESLILYGRKSFTLHGSGTNFFLHSALLLTLGITFTNKIQENSSHIFSCHPLLPHEARVVRFNWSETRRKIPREKNEHILPQKEGKEQEQKIDLSSSAFSFPKLIL